MCWYEYVVDLDGKKDEQFIMVEGWNVVQYSSIFDYYVLMYFMINSLGFYVVYDWLGKQVCIIEDNSYLKSWMKFYDIQLVEFFSFIIKDKVDFNGYMIKLWDFDFSKKYLVFMYLYGGFGSQ